MKHKLAEGSAADVDPLVLYFTLYAYNILQPRTLHIFNVNISGDIYIFSILVDKSGDVCISILHEPGDDKWGYEKASERWLPVHTVETILISVISMLADPNDESPANVDAAKDWRDNYPEFKRKVARCVRKSQEDI